MEGGINLKAGTGITGFGGYIPFHRLRGEITAAEWCKSPKKTEKAVAFYDEDSITMSVAAGMKIQPSDWVKQLDAVFFASATSPFYEKQGAASIAGAMDIKEGIRLADFAGTLRAGSEAILSALDLAQLGKNTLVACADCRQGAPEGDYEIALGDGAACFVFGNDNLLAEYLGSYSVGKDIPDTWRSHDMEFVHNWDVRYAQTMSYEVLVRAAYEGFCKQTGLQAADFSKIIIYAHEQRHAEALAKKLGFEADQVQDLMYAQIGNTGNAAVPLAFAAALEEASPGDKLLLICYGEGCDVIAFEATEGISSFSPSESVREQIAEKNNTLTYAKYLKWKDLIFCEPQRRPEQERSSLPDYVRNYKKNLSMYGSRCRCCGTPQFPPQRICAKCGAWDEMEPYRFAERKAVVKTFTLDGLSVSKDSPNNLVVAEFEGGGKIMTFLVDCKADQIYVGMPVVPTFRSMFHANGLQTYAWKLKPARKEGK